MLPLAGFVLIQDLRFGHRLDALVLDPPDDGTLLYVKGDDLGVGMVGAVFYLQADIFEELRVPEGLEVSPESVFAVGVALSSENLGLQRVGADAAVAHKLHALHQSGLLRASLRNPGNCWRTNAVACSLTRGPCLWHRTRQGEHQDKQKHQQGRQEKRQARIVACGHAPQPKMCAPPPAPRKGPGLCA